jgi:hypothetical protein
MDAAFERRSAQRRQSMDARIARSKEEAEVLARERENALPPFERAEAIWGLLRDLATIRGSDGSEFRLDRSVARVERRTR